MYYFTAFLLSLPWIVPLLVTYFPAAPLALAG